jgi:hypothetical protein
MHCPSIFPFHNNLRSYLAFINDSLAIQSPLSSTSSPATLICTVITWLAYLNSHLFLHFIACLLFFSWIPSNSLSTVIYLFAVALTASCRVFTIYAVCLCRSAHVTWQCFIRKLISNWDSRDNLVVFLNGFVCFYLFLLSNLQTFKINFVNLHKLRFLNFTLKSPKHRELFRNSLVCLDTPPSTG